MRTVAIDDIRNISAGFEGAFNRLYPDMLSMQNDVYRETKGELLRHLRSKRRMLKKAGASDIDIGVLDRLSNGIGNQDMSLKEKLEFAFIEYEPIIADLYTRYVASYELTDVSTEKMIALFVKARNGIAHGDILTMNQVGQEVILCFVMVRYMLYVMQLKMIGMADDNIKAIVNKVFR